MKRFFEKIVEGILACSGFVTSLTIVLIVLFLFSEALGLFGSKVVEEGYVLALNRQNTVNQLSPAQIKGVFDEEITNWRELGGEDMPIRLFRLEDVDEYYTEEQLGEAYENAGTCITRLVERTPGIVAFVPGQFIVRPDSVHVLEDQTAEDLCRLLSHPRFHATVPDSDPRITARFYTGAMLALLRWWLDSEEPVSEECLLSHLERFIPAL